MEDKKKQLIYKIISFTVAIIVITVFIFMNTSSNRSKETEFGDPGINNRKKGLMNMWKEGAWKNNYREEKEDNKRKSVVDYELLKKMFPGNLALPTHGIDELEEKKRERERRNLAYGQISANRASVEDIDNFYNEQLKITRDAIKLLEFVLKEYKGKLSESQKKKYEFALDQFRKREALIPERRQLALDRLKKK